MSVYSHHTPYINNSQCPCIIIKHLEWILTNACILSHHTCINISQCLCIITTRRCILTFTICPTRSYHVSQSFTFKYDKLGDTTCHNPPSSNLTNLEMPCVTILHSQIWPTRSFHIISILKQIQQHSSLQLVGNCCKLRMSPRQQPTMQ